MDPSSGSWSRPERTIENSRDRKPLARSLRPWNLASNRFGVATVGELILDLPESADECGCCEMSANGTQMLKSGNNDGWPGSRGDMMYVNDCQFCCDCIYTDTLSVNNSRKGTTRIRVFICLEWRSGDQCGHAVWSNLTVANISDILSISNSRIQFRSGGFYKFLQITDKNERKNKWR